MKRLFNKGVLALSGVLTIALCMDARGGVSQALQDDGETRQDSAVSIAGNSVNEASVVDEVIWVVGDEPILKSEVEAMRIQAEMENIRFHGDPDCTIPEQIAVQKLYLHQASIDSIEVSESDITQGVEQQINYWLQMVGGSKEKLEEYRRQSIAQMRNSMRDEFRNRQLVQEMQKKLVADIKVSPADVRMYFKDIPEDSIPFVPTEVEVQIVTNTPRVEPEEIARVKNELRDYTERVNSGETSFATLARLYSEDPGSARLGGELDYEGRSVFDPAFANVAFNLTDPKKISKIVETEFGFHIIQLIDKRGDKVKCRHILLRPKISEESLQKSVNRLDSIATDIRSGKFTFEEAATYVSDDKNTRSCFGLMYPPKPDKKRTSKFRMQDLPSEVARVVDTLKVGQVSDAFRMIDSQTGKTVVAIVKLKSRVEGHRATITEDFEIMMNVVLDKRREEFLKEWVKNKLKNTYVWMNERYRNCEFEFEGWVK